MSTTITIPWGMWYGNQPHELTFPDGWDVVSAPIAGGPDIGDAGIRRALAEPIGAPPLREVARGRRDAAILIDDLTRPTPSYRLLPYLLEELAAGGIDADHVRIVCAVAAHRPMLREDFIKKIGLELFERLEVLNHDAYDNLEFYGTSSQGIPIWVNHEFARSDVKIAAGMITPRGGMFGGGAKLLLPGASGRETIYLNHAYCPQEAFRDHVDEVAHIVGLEYIVNPLLNMEMGIMGLVAGDPREAFWAGVEMGKRLYATDAPEEMDVAICNAWPKDTEGTQAGMARVPLAGTQRRLVKEEGTVVIASACSEGLGFHSVMGPGTRLKRLAEMHHAQHEGAEQVVYSPNLTRPECRMQFGEHTPFFKTWGETMAYLERKHGPRASACVYPCGAMQYVSD